MERAAQIDLLAAIAREILPFDETPLDVGTEHFAIPVAMVGVGDLAGIGAAEHLADAGQNRLIGEPIAARGKAVLEFAIGGIEVRIPYTGAHPLDQVSAHAIPLDRQRVIGVGHIDILDALGIGRDIGWKPGRLGKAPDVPEGASEPARNDAMALREQPLGQLRRIADRSERCARVDPVGVEIARVRRNQCGGDREEL